MEKKNTETQMFWLRGEQSGAFNGNSAGYFPLQFVETQTGARRVWIIQSVQSIKIFLSWEEFLAENYMLNL